MVAAVLLVVALLFIDWYELAQNPARMSGNPTFICGDGQYECTGWETFPILRWLLLARRDRPADPRLHRRSAATSSPGLRAS